MSRKNTLTRRLCRIYTRQSTTISICAMIGCITAAAVGSPRESGFDYLGLIIGILALMVTFVVAWQIWQTIDARNVIKEFRRESNLMQTRAKKDIQNTRMLCMALLATHEGETEVQRKNFAGAYMKYFTSLALFMMIKDPEDAVRIEDNLNLVEKLLNDNIKNRDETFLTRLKEVESDIDKIYETLIIFSEKVSLPQDKITRIKELHRKRKAYTTKH